MHKLAERAPVHTTKPGSERAWARSGGNRIDCYGSAARAASPPASHTSISDRGGLVVLGPTPCRDIVGTPRLSSISGEVYSPISPAANRMLLDSRFTGRRSLSRFRDHRDRGSAQWS